MLHLITALSLAIAPSFDTFLTHSLGYWRGAAYCWQREPEGDNWLPLGIAPGYVSTPTACSTEVAEVMRSWVNRSSTLRRERGGACMLLTDSQAVRTGRHSTV